MVLFMGFDGINRIQTKFRKEVKKSIKIETSFTDWKMFVHLFMIIVEVDLAQIISEGFHPFKERGLAEDMVVARIETESETG
jgi:hypothetical protein